MVPSFLKKAYKNQTTWKWHVQIPYSYWDKKFPLSAYKSREERSAAINKYMDEMYELHGSASHLQIVSQHLLHVAAHLS